MKGVPYFPELFKKRSVIKYKKQVFSTESKERHQNIKRTEIITCIRGVRSLVNTSLFTLKFFLVLSKQLFILIKRPL